MTEDFIARLSSAGVQSDKRFANWRKAAAGTVLVLAPAVALGVAARDAYVPASAPGAQAQGTCPSSFVIDFAGLPAGTILGEQYAGFGVHISGVANGGSQFPDKMIVFDTNAPPTHDPDLAVDIGNIAIFPTDLIDSNGDTLVDDPDENNFGGRATFTFDQAVTIGSFIFVDKDQASSAFGIAYDAVGAVLAQVSIPQSSNASVQSIDVNAQGVRRFEIVYSESGAFTGIEVSCPATPTPTPPVTTSTPTPTAPAATATPTATPEPNPCRGATSSSASPAHDISLDRLSGAGRIRDSQAKTYTAIVTNHNLTGAEDIQVCFTVVPMFGCSAPEIDVALPYDATPGEPDNEFVDVSGDGIRDSVALAVAHGVLPDRSERVKATVFFSGCPPAPNQQQTPFDYIVQADACHEGDPAPKGFFGACPGINDSASDPNQNNDAPIQKAVNDVSR